MDLRRERQSCRGRRAAARAVIEDARLHRRAIAERRGKARGVGELQGVQPLAQHGLDCGFPALVDAQPLP
jgi:hypothetical protein